MYKFEIFEFANLGKVIIYFKQMIFVVLQWMKHRNQ